MTKKKKLLIAALALLLSAAAAQAQVLINGTNFPDANFREYIEYSDYNKDGEFSAKEIETVRSINVSNRSIADLTGIEYFTALKYLDCQEN